MIKLIIILSASMLITGCINKSKDENSIVLSDKTKFISQRQLHEKAFGNFNFKNEQQWDSLKNISFEKVIYRTGKVDTTIRTFGWHIYSNGSSWRNYNFPMLWGLSYFSYAIQPETGNYKSIHQWKTTALIDSAKANDCKVFLSVSNFGSKNNSIFLENLKGQRTLIDSLSSLLAFRDANGINIDFEGVSKKNKKDFTNFILEVSKKLKQVNPEYMISLCLYAEDWNNIFDIKTIDSYVDFYTLMGYDYYGEFSKTTGPVTPLKKSVKFGNGLETSVNTYQNEGVHLDKLIIGLPYYGVEWYTRSSEIGAIVTRFKSHPPYKSIREYYIDSLSIPLQFDLKSSSSYLLIEDSTNHYRQLFFEDVKSLSTKYDWIKNNKIGGVGIWALGYDNGYPELWNLLTEKFSQRQNTTLYNNE
jgi:spore germination protein YaaH